MQSTTTHQFSQIPQADIQRSSFDRSHGHKTTFDFGELIPVYVDEALPGDTFKMDMTAFGRLATPLKPVMDNMFVDVHFFSVPMRQLWDNFRKFMGEQANPLDSIDFTMPQSKFVPTSRSLEDYMGLPVNQGTVEHNALYSRAYKHIYNEWYRDQNLQNSVVFPTDNSGEITPTTILKRGKRHDYFTSCLPWPQKGDSVKIPLGTTAPVEGIGTSPSQTFGSSNIIARETDKTVNSTFAQGMWITEAGAGRTYIEEDPDNPDFPNIRVNLTDATAATVNALRQAFQIQKLLERDARGGTRYAEVIKAHFNVKFMDVTYRPEFLGGGSGHININPVTQTSATDTQPTPKGDLSAFGTIGFQNAGFTKSFTEHCIIFGIMSARADLTYQQGINRMFTRSTRYDYYWPALANIGEQAVLNKEIYHSGTAPDTQVFGYQERYGEYRYKPSQITGLFRSSVSGNLDTWHLAQEFGSLPVLGSDFITENPPISRIIALQTEPHLIMDTYFSLRCSRPMPLYGVPGFMDRF